LILATQRPSVDVLTGVIKANFPARMSFQVTSRHDSRTILDCIGAENLLGMGDMLLTPPGVGNLMRAHGAYVSEVEIQRVVEFLKTQGKPQYDENILKPRESEEGDGSGMPEEDEYEDELYDQAVAFVSEQRYASVSMIQRRMRIGYNRAARLIERMEKEGVVGPGDGAKPREVLTQQLQSP
jgi:S-DNA-T family DNA segregation ATPase FtsK/SpoIIIE